MTATTFKGKLAESFCGMNEENTDSKAKYVAKVMLQNFLFMFCFTGALGFSLAAAGMLTPQHDIYVFTLSFSSLWGAVGAAAAWNRMNNDIQTPKIFREILGALGVSDTSSENISKLVLESCGRSTRYIFIPFVHTPKS